jgi:hypothetical protein
MKSLTLLAAAALAVLVAGSAYADNYVVRNGQKLKADAIEANAAGAVILVTGSGRQTLQYKDLDRVVSDKPAEIRKAEEFFYEEKYNDTLQTLTSEVFGKYRYTGWGAYISHLRGRSYLGLKQPAEAEKVIKDGMAYAPKEGREGLLNVDLVQALIEQGDKTRVDRAKAIMAELKPANDDELAFLYNMQGKLLTQSGKKREALLKHLTVVMVFEKADRSARVLAYDEAIILMQEMGDNRHSYLSEKKKAEFR